RPDIEPTPLVVPAVPVPKPEPRHRPGIIESAPSGKVAVTDASPGLRHIAEVQLIPQVWEDLQHFVAACAACGLQAGRSQIVFGAGAVDSPEWLLVGEAPGEHDDKMGLPFQGRPGALLQAMLSSIGVQESTVFFTNLVKCRPLGNRTPRSEEIDACLPYLRRQITLQIGRAHV